jgi:hypothetical protein
MNSLPDTNPALQNALTMPNPATDQNVSQEGSHAINGSMPAGEPVHSTSLHRVLILRLGGSAPGQASGQALIHDVLPAAVATANGVPVN